VPDEGAGVDAGERRDAAVGEPGQPAALGVGRVLAVDPLAHDHGPRVHPVGLHVVGGDAVVADQRIGEDDDLAGVARVAHGLLVAGHRGVEDDLAKADAASTDALAVEADAVLEQEVRAAHTAPSANVRSRYATAPSAIVIRTRPVSRRPANAQLAERLS
jgi:hypothetical protein